MHGYINEHNIWLLAKAYLCQPTAFKENAGATNAFPKGVERYIKV
jgi:hypothetical protein